MRAEDMTPQQKLTVLSHDSYIEGPRWALPEGWLEKAVMEANSILMPKGWKKIEIESVRYAKTFTQRTIFFTLHGEAYPIAKFLELMESSIIEYNSR